MLDMTWPLRRHIDVFAGIARFAAEHADWACVIDDFATNTLSESRGPHRFYEGVIARVTPQLAKVAKQERVPLVNVWYSSPVKAVPSIFPDWNAVGRLVGDHFLDRGIRNVIALVRRGDKAELAESLEVKRLVEEEGGECQIRRVSQQFAHSRERWKQTWALLEQWLGTTRFPAGLYAGVDILGRLVAQACEDRGINIPGDLAIIAGYNEPTICEYPQPTLTSIDIGFDRIGYEAAGLMDRILKGSKPPTKPILFPPRQLVIRQSSDFIYVDDPLVTQAIHYISNHIRSPITVDDVANAVDISRRNLEQRFSAHVHRTVAEEMRRIRLEHAKRLLASQELSVAAIAKATGYGSNAQMSRVFQRELGISPRAYRQQFEEVRHVAASE